MIQIMIYCENGLMADCMHTHLMATHNYARNISSVFYSFAAILKSSAIPLNGQCSLDTLSIGLSIGQSGQATLLTTRSEYSVNGQIQLEHCSVRLNFSHCAVYNQERERERRIKQSPEPFPRIESNQKFWFTTNQKRNKTNNMLIITHTRTQE